MLHMKQVSLFRHVCLWAAVLALSSTAFAQKEAPENFVPASVLWSCGVTEYVPCDEHVAYCPWDESKTGCQPPVDRVLPPVKCFNRLTGAHVDDSFCAELARPFIPKTTCFHKDCVPVCHTPGQTDYISAAPTNRGQSPRCLQKARSIAKGCSMSTGTKVWLACLDRTSDSIVSNGNCDMPHALEWQSYSRLSFGVATCPGSVANFTSRFVSDGVIEHTVSGVVLPPEDTDASSLITYAFADGTPFHLIAEPSLSVASVPGDTMLVVPRQYMLGRKHIVSMQTLLTDDFVIQTQFREVQAPFHDDIIVTIGYENDQVFSSHRLVVPNKVPLINLPASLDYILFTDPDGANQPTNDPRRFLKISMTFPDPLENYMSSLTAVSLYTLEETAEISFTKCTLLANDKSPFSDVSLYSLEQLKQGTSSFSAIGALRTPLDTSGITRITLVCQMALETPFLADTFTFRPSLYGKVDGETRIFTLPDMEFTSFDYDTHVPLTPNRVWVKRNGELTALDGQIAKVACTDSSDKVHLDGCSTTSTSTMIRILHLTQASFRARLREVRPSVDADEYTFEVAPAAVGGPLQCTSVDFDGVFVDCSRMCESDVTEKACFHPKTKQRLEERFCAASYLSCSFPSVNIEAALTFYPSNVEFVYSGETKFLRSPSIRHRLGVPASFFNAEDVAALACRTVDPQHTVADTYWCYDTTDNVLIYHRPMLNQLDEVSQKRAILHIRLADDADARSAPLRGFSHSLWGSKGGVRMTSSDVGSIHRLNRNTNSVVAWEVKNLRPTEGGVAGFMRCYECLNSPHGVLDYVFLRFDSLGAAYVPREIGYSFASDGEDESFYYRISTNHTKVMPKHILSGDVSYLYFPLPVAYEARDFRIGFISNESSLVNRFSGMGVLSPNGAYAFATSFTRKTIQPLRDAPPPSAVVHPGEGVQYIFDVADEVLSSSLFNEATLRTSMDFTTEMHLLRFRHRADFIIPRNRITSDDDLAANFASAVPERILQAIIDTIPEATPENVRYRTFVPWVTFGILGCSPFDRCDSVDNPTCSLIGTGGCLTPGGESLPSFACKDPAVRPITADIRSCTDIKKSVNAASSRFGAYGSFVLLHLRLRPNTLPLYGFYKTFTFTIKNSPHVSYPSNPTCVAEPFTESNYYPTLSGYSLDCSVTDNGDMEISVPDYAVHLPIRVFADITRPEGSNNGAVAFDVSGEFPDTNGSPEVLSLYSGSFEVKRIGGMKEIVPEASVRTMFATFPDNTASIAVHLAVHSEWLSVDLNTIALGTLTITSPQLATLVATAGPDQCIFGHPADPVRDITPAASFSLRRLKAHDLRVNTTTGTIRVSFFMPGVLIKRANRSGMLVFTCRGFDPATIPADMPAPKLALSGVSADDVVVPSDYADNKVVYLGPRSDPYVGRFVIATDNLNSPVRDEYIREDIRRGFAGALELEDIVFGDRVLTATSNVARSLTLTLRSSFIGLLEVGMQGPMVTALSGHARFGMGTPFGTASEPILAEYGSAGRWACDYGDGNGYVECENRPCFPQGVTPVCISPTFDATHGPGAQYFCSDLRPYVRSDWTSECPQPTATGSLTRALSTTATDSFSFDGKFDVENASVMYKNRPLYVTFSHPASLAFAGNKDRGCEYSACFIKPDGFTLVVSITDRVVNFKIPADTLVPLTSQLHGAATVTVSMAPDGSNPFGSFSANIPTIPYRPIFPSGAGFFSEFRFLPAGAPSDAPGVHGYLAGTANSTLGASTLHSLVSFIVPADLVLGKCSFRFTPVNSMDKYAKNTATEGLQPMSVEADFAAREGVSHTLYTYFPTYSMPSFFYFSCEVLGDSLPSASIEVALWKRRHQNTRVSEFSSFITVLPVADAEAAYRGHDVFVRVELRGTREHDFYFTTRHIQSVFTNFDIIPRPVNRTSATVDIFAPGLARGTIRGIVDRIDEITELHFINPSNPIQAEASILSVGTYQCLNAVGGYQPCEELLYCGATLDSLNAACFVDGSAVASDYCGFAAVPVPNPDCGAFRCRSPADNTTFVDCNDASLCEDDCSASVPITALPTDAGIFEQVCVYNGAAVDAAVFCPSSSVAYADYADTCRSTALCAVLPVNDQGERVHSSDNSSWSSCSVTCGSGTRTRHTACGHSDTSEGDLVEPVDADLCDGIPFKEGELTMPCDEEPCSTFEWECAETNTVVFATCTEDSHWSECTVNCGGGTRTRSTGCRAYDAAGAPQGMVDASLCTSPRPTESESCNEQSCAPEWVCTNPETGDADDCSTDAAFPACPAATCDAVSVERTVSCELSSGAPAPIADCGSPVPAATKDCPVLTEGCNVVFTWKETPAAVCDASVPGRCVTYRSVDVVCLRSVDGAAPEPVATGCDASTRPASAVVCDDDSAVVVCGTHGGCDEKPVLDDAGAAVPGVFAGVCACDQGYTGETCDDVLSFEDLAVSADSDNATLTATWTYLGPTPDAQAVVVVSRENVTLPVVLGTVKASDGAITGSIETLADVFGSGSVTVTLKIGDASDSVSYVLLALCEYSAFDCADGSCDLQTGACVCDGDFSGRRCEISPCETKGCNAEVSTCTDDDGYADCNCPVGPDGSELYADDRCLTPVSCVGSIECSNGGVPTGTVDGNGTATCTGCACEGNWGGDVCEACGLDTCANGGTPNEACETCVCKPGHTSATCGCRAVHVTALFSGDVATWYSGSTPHALAAWAKAAQGHLTNVIGDSAVVATLAWHKIVEDHNKIAHVQTMFYVTGICSGHADSLMHAFALLVDAPAAATIQTAASALFAVAAAPTAADPADQPLYNALDAIGSAFSTGSLSTHPSFANFNADAGIGLSDPLCDASQPNAACPRDVGNGGRVESEEARSGSSGLSDGAIAGIVVGCVVGGLLLLLLVLAICCGWCCFGSGSGSGSTNGVEMSSV